MAAEARVPEVAITTAAPDGVGGREGDSGALLITAHKRSTPLHQTPRPPDVLKATLSLRSLSVRVMASSTTSPREAHAAKRSWEVAARVTLPVVMRHPTKSLQRRRYRRRCRRRCRRHRRRLQQPRWWESERQRQLQVVFIAATRKPRRRQR
jgi:hypothetical protein